MTEFPEGTPQLPTDAQADRWTQRQQLAVVALTHLAIGLFVFLIILAGGGETSLGGPWLFYVVEGSIVMVCGWQWIDRGLWDSIVKRGGWTLKRKPMSWGARTAYIPDVGVWMLRLAFALQLLALIPLFKTTGGPIASPFAPMAIAIAIFTPFLTNHVRTVMVVAVVTAAYYFGVVFFMDDLAAAWAHLAVSLSILLLSSILTAFKLSRGELEHVSAARRD